MDQENDCGIFDLGKFSESSLENPGKSVASQF